MTEPAPAQALPQDRACGLGGAMPSLAALIAFMLAELARLLVTPGAVKSFNHFCQLFFDIERHIVRLMIAEAKRLDPSLPHLDPDDFDLVWNADGTDFEIVHWSEVTPSTRADWLGAMRAYLETRRMMSLIALHAATRHSPWRRRRRRRPLDIFAPAHASVASARAPP